MNPENKIRKTYHSLLRPEVLNLIPQTAKRIIDYGCGTGELGKALKQRQECKVIGIENNKDAADSARKNLDNCIDWDLNNLRPCKYGSKYDCLIFADILEHLLNPWAVLNNELKALQTDGTVIISLPNIAHHSIINNLEKGVFQYKNAGICDISHLCFFTLLSASELITRAGLKIKKVIHHPSKTDPRQYVFQCKKIKQKFPEALCTLIMPVCNNAHLTRQCINSIFETTLAPFKLIIVDNGSTDGTNNFLRAEERVLHIEGTHNLGFAKGINSALQMVETPYFALINNDLIFSRGWLSTLLETFNHNEKIKAVGPRTNYCAGPQMHKGAAYSGREMFHKFSEQFKNIYQDDYFFTPMLVFFCTVFKSEILQTVGLLDERFGMGNFEDNAYCKMIADQGGLMAVNNGCFIHHYGHQTFKTLGVNYNAQIQKNYKIFMDLYMQGKG